MQPTPNSLFRDAQLTLSGPSTRSFSRRSSRAIGSARSGVLALAASLALCGMLMACNKAPDTASASGGGTAAAKRQISAELLAAEATGFTVGAVMSANTVYVMFDPQCPHCGKLWQASLPLQRQVRFVWIPVAIMNPASAPQAAALLTAAEPDRTMQEHETSLLSGQGGISASASVPDPVRLSVERNTKLFAELGLESVPYVVTKHRSTGQLMTRSGALTTAALAELLGLAP